MSCVLLQVFYISFMYSVCIAKTAGTAINDTSKQPDNQKL